jgi:hypothetical protein
VIKRMKRDACATYKSRWKRDDLYSCRSCLFQGVHKQQREHMAMRTRAFAPRTKSLVDRSRSRSVREVGVIHKAPLGPPVTACRRATGDAAHTHTLSLRGIITNHNELRHIHPASFIRSIFNRYGTIDMEAFSPGDARASTAKTPEPFKVNGKGGGIFMETIHRYQVALGSG